MLRSAIIAVVVVLVGIAICVIAADVAPNALTPALEETLSSAARRIVADSLPREFDGQKDWGHTTKIVDGLRLRDTDDHLTLRKHTKEVNDGFWRKYSAQVIDTEHLLKLRIENLKQTSAGHATLQVFCAARLHGKARVEQWKDGVELLNSTCDADCGIEARIDCELAWSWSPGKYFGEFTVVPKVTGADLKLTQFELKKLGKIEGWAARELGENLSPMIAKRLREEQPKLVDKLNRAIAKKLDRLHFSADKALDNGWTKLQSILKIDTTPANNDEPPGE